MGGLFREGKKRPGNEFRGLKKRMYNRIDYSVFLNTLVLNDSISKLLNNPLRIINTL